MIGGSVSKEPDRMQLLEASASHKSATGIPIFHAPTIDRMKYSSPAFGATNKEERCHHEIIELQEEGWKVVQPIGELISSGARSAGAKRGGGRVLSERRRVLWLAEEDVKLHYQYRLIHIAFSVRLDLKHGLHRYIRGTGTFST